MFLVFVALVFEHQMQSNTGSTVVLVLCRSMVRMPTKSTAGKKTLAIAWLRYACAPEGRAAHTRGAATERHDECVRGV